MINNSCLQLLSLAGFIALPHKHVQVSTMVIRQTLLTLEHSITFHSILSKISKKRLFLLILPAPPVFILLDLSAVADTFTRTSMNSTLLVLVTTHLLGDSHS